MTDSPLISRAMLVGLSIGSWGASKQDKEASKATAELYGAKVDSGK